MQSSRSWVKEGTHQRDLEIVLTQLFGAHNIYKLFENNKKSAPFWNKKDNTFEIDVWLPSLQLGFEFQDLYHFTPTFYSQRPLDVIKSIDKSKNEVIHRKQATLISVPCWWNASIHSLIATIRFYRPDLSHLCSNISTTETDIISLNPPSDFFVLYSVPQIGELMLPSFVDSVSKFSEGVSHASPWWIGEKYDGIRCVWNPLTNILRGLTIDLPIKCISKIPRVFIDGELWCGRGLYMETQKTFSFFDFSMFRIIAFDCPEKSTKHTFEKRYTSLLNAIPTTHTFTVCASRMLCKEKHTLNKLVKEIIENGGEGAIAQKCKSLYESGRTNSVIKLKTANRDSEALVLVVAPNSLTLKLPSGIQFEVDKSENMEVKEGEIITFEHDNSSRTEIPTNPKIIRVRKDLSWDDVISEIFHDNTIKDFTSKPNKYWTTEEGKKDMRKSLEEFSHSRNLSPLNPETWYSFLAKDVAHIKGLANQSYANMVRLLFPEMNIDISRFAVLPKGYLMDPAQRKALLDDFANQNNFDPLVADNWYSVQASTFSEHKSGATVLQFYNGSLRKALAHLYPNVAFDSSRFIAGSHWANLKNRKHFFDSFARENLFDPLVSENWYSVSLQSIYAKQHATAVMQYYQGDFITAVSQIYPNIGIDKSKYTESNQFYEEKTRKEFFVQFAHENNFDPLVAENWYKLSYKTVLSAKNMGIILRYYEGNFPTALACLFPNMKIDKNRFNSFTPGHWSDTLNHKLFFDSFANDNNFDPLVAKNWHFIKPSQIIARRGALSVLNYYKRNYAKALINVYPNIGLNIFDIAYCQDYSMWEDKRARKGFFESFAKDNNFDPLVNTNWYNIYKLKYKLLERRHSKPLLKLYNGNANTALMDSFPDIGLLLKI